jgi:hypothetical protein
MRIVKKMIYVFSITVLFVACKKENYQKLDDSNDSSNVIVDSSKIDDSAKLIGCWINPQLSDTIWTFDKAENLQENTYGFIFNYEQVFIERDHSGWCGTAPVSYSDYEGTWSKNDYIINIASKYWGGTTDYQWKIISVDENTLKIYKVYTNYN